PTNLMIARKIVCWGSYEAFKEGFLVINMESFFFTMSFPRFSAISVFAAESRFGSSELAGSLAEGTGNDGST
ncbi:hypothetical protein Tco_0864305, partial [Tanacetum coccineum]